METTNTYSNTYNDKMVGYLDEVAEKLMEVVTLDKIDYDCMNSAAQALAELAKAKAELLTVQKKKVNSSTLEKVDQIINEYCDDIKGLKLHPEDSNNVSFHYDLLNILVNLIESRNRMNK